MKEFSVSFYKKLIMLVIIAIFTVAMVFAVLAVKSFLWDKTEGNGGKNTGEQSDSSGESISSGDDIQKIVEKAEKRKKALDEGNKEQNKIPLTGEGLTDEDKVVYLTFDDGASNNTSEIIQILEENGVRATFFFNTGRRASTDVIIKEAYDKGNAIGLASSKSKSLSTIYESPQAYGRDIDQNIQRIFEITGTRPEIIRFPGGSKNAYTNAEYSEYMNEASSRNLVYFDWNLCAEGQGHIRDLESLVANATNIKAGTDKYIVLMHDNGNVNTCEALRRIIGFYKEKGFQFMTLSSSVSPIVF